MDHDDQNFDPDFDFDPDPDVDFDPDFDRRVDYGESFDRFRNKGGTDVEACVAAVVNAALLLVDPCDVMWMGLDADVAHAYGSAASRISEEVCGALVDSAVLCAVHERGLDPDEVVLGGGQADVFGFVPLPVIVEIVHRALMVEFSVPDGLAPEVAAATGAAFDRIVSAEFGELATIRLPDFPKGDEVARLVAQRVGSFPFALVR